MKAQVLLRAIAVALMLGAFGGFQATRAQDDTNDDEEFGAGIYLGTCDSLVEGAALFDLGDLELESEDLSDDNGEGEDGGEDEDGGEGEDEDVESELDEESEGDETDVEAAIGSGDEDEDEDENVDPDREVIIQEGAPLVYVNEGSTFEADLVELVYAPFAVAVRMDPTGAAEGEGEDGGDSEDGGEFLACGEFGGAVAGSELIIPLNSSDGGNYSGLALLEQTGEIEASASIYLFDSGNEVNGDDSGDESTSAGDNGDSDEEDSEDSESDSDVDADSDDEDESSVLDEILGATPTN